MAIQFKTATRKKVRLKMLITGPTNGGKTFGALHVAYGLAPGKIALCDSEHDRADYYADVVPFEKTTPESHRPKAYIAVIHAAVAAGFEVLILDSLSHAWLDVLARKDAFDQSNRGKNPWANWLIFGPEWDELMREILEAPIHIICTARSKMAHEQVENGGQKKVIKLGLAPQLRDNTEYEFSIGFSVEPATHTAQVSKDNTHLFGEVGKVWDLTNGEVPALLRQWLETAKEIDRPLPETIMAIDDALLLVPQAKQDAARRKVAERRQRGMTEEEGQALLASIRSVIPSALSAPPVRIDASATAEERTEPAASESAPSAPAIAEDPADVAAREALSAAASMKVKLSTGHVILGDCSDAELLRIGLMAETANRTKLVQAVALVQADRARIAKAEQDEAPPMDDAPPHSADDAPEPLDSLEESAAA